MKAKPTFNDEHEENTIFVQFHKSTKYGLHDKRCDTIQEPRVLLQNKLIAVSLNKKTG